MTDQQSHIKQVAKAAFDARRSALSHAFVYIDSASSTILQSIFTVEILLTEYQIENLLDFQTINYHSAQSLQQQLKTNTTTKNSHSAKQYKQQQSEGWDEWNEEFDEENEQSNINTAFSALPSSLLFFITSPLCPTLYSLFTAHIIKHPNIKNYTIWTTMEEKELKKRFGYNYEEYKRELERHVQKEERLKYGNKTAASLNLTIEYFPICYSTIFPNTFLFPSCSYYPYNNTSDSSNIFTSLGQGLTSLSNLSKDVTSSLKDLPTSLENVKDKLKDLPANLSSATNKIFTPTQHQHTASPSQQPASTPSSTSKLSLPSSSFVSCLLSFLQANNYKPHCFALGKEMETVSKQLIEEIHTIDEEYKRKNKRERKWQKVSLILCDRMHDLVTTTTHTNISLLDQMLRANQFKQSMKDQWHFQWPEEYHNHAEQLIGLCPHNQSNLSTLLTSAAPCLPSNPYLPSFLFSASTDEKLMLNLLMKLEKDEALKGIRKLWHNVLKKEKIENRETSKKTSDSVTVNELQYYTKQLSSSPSHLAQYHNLYMLTQQLILTLQQDYLDMFQTLEQQCIKEYMRQREIQEKQIVQKNDFVIKGVLKQIIPLLQLSSGSTPVRPQFPLPYILCFAVFLYSLNADGTVQYDPSEEEEFQHALADVLMQSEMQEVEWLIGIDKDAAVAEEEKRKQDDERTDIDELQNGESNPLITRLDRVEKVVTDLMQRLKDIGVARYSVSAADLRDLTSPPEPTARAEGFLPLLHRLFLRIFEPHCTLDDFEHFHESSVSLTSLKSTVTASAPSLSTFKSVIGGFGSMLKSKAEQFGFEIQQRPDQSEIMIVVVAGGITLTEIQHIQNICMQNNRIDVLIGSNSIATSTHALWHIGQNSVQNDSC